MKGQLIPFVFLVLLVASVMIGYVYYNTFYGSEYQLNILNTRVIDAIRNIIEDFKNYAKLSLTYSSHQALREHACKGGLIGAVPWICNGPNPVEPDQSKQCLEKYTKYYLNVYSSFFNTSLPAKVSIRNFTDLVYDINAGNIFSGKYDEGNFWVNSSGARITITSTNANEFENISMNDYITKDRYWYLFRNFYDWAMADVYTPCICGKISCSCSSGSGEETCGTQCNADAEDCANQALNNLQGRFDEYVKCEKTQQCCAQGIGPACSGACGCQGWSNNICISPCQHECKDPFPLEICNPGSSGYSASQVAYSGYSNPYSNSHPYKISFSPDDCYCGIEGRLAAGYRFWCTDIKYYVPSANGPVPLTFSASAIAFLKDPCACCSTCGCPGCGC
jgi:hypothetical protein